MLAVIRGAGDIASAVALRLWRSGIGVIMTEVARPLTVRRTVAFSEAVRLGKAQVEGVVAERASSTSHALELLGHEGVVPVLVDPCCTCLEAGPDVLVDAILAKRNTGTSMDMAPVVIGVGPGFTAGADCHAVVETMRGHTLGRVYYEGSALPNTAVPGLVGGFAGERVLRAPCEGVFREVAQIGDHVESGQVVAYVAWTPVVEGVPAVGEAPVVGGAPAVGETPVVATISGVLRGLIAGGTHVTRGLKCGDVDPRDDASFCRLVSDKGLAVAGGVLEAILHLNGTFSGIPKIPKTCEVKRT